MKLKKILLTGDDGYQSLGLRILIAVLNDEFDLKIAATKKQQTGVGGGLTFTRAVKWGESKVDGVDAVWVDALPADAMEFAQGYFEEKFDLVISGINFGENVGYTIASSGTFGAAWRAVGAGLAPKAIMMSWVRPQSEWFMEHSKKDSVSGFLDYPGKFARKLIDICVKEDFWGVNLVNINFPAEPTGEYKITKLYPDLTKYYNYPVEIDRKAKTFKYPDNMYSDETVEISNDYDIGALRKGFVSVTPLDL